ncbi:LigA protein [Streptomyces microflavus DSM 40593]|uniref:LigA protein n=1 Tax=Streptomyces microflavus DSM 40593 TaxID=1303692 RepID=N0CXI1_STRMI|nr:hypothetical protein [Streptomyces microflavus]AGK80415.1 LigA protein [Streptomyces microflavus DSM 40593]
MTTQPSIRGIRPAGYVLDEAPLAAPVAQAADDLRAVREQWGDLLAAIGRAPRAEWPPRECREWEQPAAAADAPAVGRMPLVLREHPAPLNLTALDAAVQTERELFELCDAVAASVQRPVRRRPSLNIPSYSGRTAPARIRIVADRADRADPARWSYASPTDPGSRAYGVHWAAVWLEGRALGEESGDLFTAVRPLLADEITATARRARARVERALGRDGQPTALDRPCPYCRGPLTAYTRSGDPAAATVVCGTGSACTAPVLLNGRRRREWSGADLIGLFVALEAAK